MYADERKVKKITAEKKKFDKTAYDIDYAKKKTKRFLLTLSTVNDADIIKHLEKISNRNGYIKGLIRHDMKDSE